MKFMIVDIYKSGSTRTQGVDSAFSTTYSEVLNKYKISEQVLSLIENIGIVHIKGVDVDAELSTRTYIYIGE